jgi:hypothetical protein
MTQREEDRDSRVSSPEIQIQKRTRRGKEISLSYLVVREAGVHEEEAAVLQQHLIGIDVAKSLKEETEPTSGPLKLTI